MGSRFHGLICKLLLAEVHIVAVDYVSKWVEAVALLENNEKSVVGFLKNNIYSQDLAHLELSSMIVGPFLQQGIQCASCQIWD